MLLWTCILFKKTRKKKGFTELFFAEGPLLKALERAVELVGWGEMGRGAMGRRWASTEEGRGMASRGLFFRTVVAPTLESSTAVIQTGVLTTSSTTESPSAVGTTIEWVSASCWASFQEIFALSRMLVRRIEELRRKINKHIEMKLHTV